MSEENSKREKNLFIVMGSIVIIMLGILLYVHIDGQKKIEEQKKEIKIAQEETHSIAKELEQLRTDKEAAEIQRQKDELEKEKLKQETERQNEEILKLLEDREKVVEETSSISERYTTYHNNTFGFSIDIPRDFIVYSENNKGVVLVSPDKQGKIFATGNYKTDNETNKQMYEEQLYSAQNAGGEVTYHACGDDWFVVSWKINGKGNYLKQFTSLNKEFLYVVMFPMSQQLDYAPIIEHMEDTFHRDNI